MNAGAANVIVECVLKGGFDVLDALYSLSFMNDTSDISEAPADDVDKLLGDHGVMAIATVKGGGAFVYLFSHEDASKLVTLSEEEEATIRDTLSGEDWENLNGILDSMFGAGASRLSEKIGQTLELEKAEVRATEGETAAALMEIVGEAPTAAIFHFTAEPHFDGTGALIYSASIEESVPSELIEAIFGEEEPKAGQQPLVSEEEMNDILSGFTPEDEEPEVSRGPAASKSAPANLDVILDIELTATARLGSVEMPISEILNLGPGSIIEVGHLVDEPIELLVNDKLIARGDVVVVDEKFGLRITEVVSQAERIESLR